jgi:Zn-finger nucleic acid-binding protein
MYCPECATQAIPSTKHYAMSTYRCPRCNTLWAWDGTDDTGPCYRVLAAPPPRRLSQQPLARERRAP